MKPNFTSIRAQGPHDAPFPIPGAPRFHPRPDALLKLGHDPVCRLVSLASMIVVSSVASCTFSRRDAVGVTCRLNTVSGHLTAPCGDFGKSADVDRFDEIGSHIWSTI
jgi:hypothetical protein